MKNEEPYILFDDAKSVFLKDERNRAVYESLSAEYELLDRMLVARKRAKMSQTEVAKKMKTSKSAVCRIEGAEVYNSHSPSIATLRRYAKALGCRLDIRFIKERKTHAQ